MKSADSKIEIMQLESHRKYQTLISFDDQL